MSKIILQRDNVQRIVTDEEAAKKLEKNGYIRVTGASKQEAVTSLDSMNLEELRIFAKKQGIEGVSALKKDELLSVLKEGESDGEA